MGYWNSGLLDNDHTLDFVDILSVRLKRDLERNDPSVSDFYCAAIFLRGVASAVDAGTQPLFGDGPVKLLPLAAKELAETYINNLYKVISHVDVDFQDVLYRERKLMEMMVIHTQEDK